MMHMNFLFFSQRLAFQKRQIYHHSNHCLLRAGYFIIGGYIAACLPAGNAWSVFYDRCHFLSIPFDPYLRET